MFLKFYNKINLDLKNTLKTEKISEIFFFSVGSQTIALQGDDDRSDLLDGRTELK